MFPRPLSLSKGRLSLAWRPVLPLDLPEREALEAFITFHRQTLLWKCQGLTGEQLAARPIPSSGISLLGIVRHMAQVERHWWRNRVAGGAVAPLYEDDAEWGPLDPSTAAADYQQLLDEWARHNGHADLVREAIDGAVGE